MEKYSIKENVSKNVFTKSGFYNKPFRHEGKHCKNQN